MGKKKEGGKKKGGKSKKKADAVEPPHDPSWERAMRDGVWRGPVTALPDSNVWPTWGALREAVLSSARAVRIAGSPSVHDAFLTELAGLSPPRLAALDLAGSPNLRQVVLSPLASCPQLATLDLSDCAGCDSLLVQSASLTTIRLAGCSGLRKLLLHCPALTSLDVAGCPSLDCVTIWSGALTALDLAASGTPQLSELNLHCPALAAPALPPVAAPQVAGSPPAHPPVAAMLREGYRAAAEGAAKAQEAEWQSERAEAGIPAVWRPLC